MAYKEIKLDKLGAKALQQSLSSGMDKRKSKQSAKITKPSEKKK